MAANTAESEEAHQLILASGKMTGDLRRVLVDSLRKSGFSKQNAHFGGSAMNKIAEGKINTQEDINGLVAGAIGGGKFGAANIAGQSSYSLGMLNKEIAKIEALPYTEENKSTKEAANRVIENARLALNTPTLNNNINVKSRPGVVELSRPPEGR